MWSVCVKWSSIRLSGRWRLSKKSVESEDVDLEIFRSLFPCGSITGAPKKIATWNYLDLGRPRGGLQEPLVSTASKWATIFNVAIRTIQLYKEQAIYGVGGGITWDSTWVWMPSSSERAAVLYIVNKLAGIYNWKISQKNLLFEDQHLERLRTASRYFAFLLTQKFWDKRLKQSVRLVMLIKDYRLRISLSKSGDRSRLLKCAPLSTSFCQAQLCLQGNFATSFYLLQNDSPTAFEP